MKTMKLILGLAAPILAVWAVRSKIGSEHVANAPEIATYVKLAYKPVIKWAANQVLKGRHLDRADPHKGRFTQTDVNRILDRTWLTYDELAPTAGVEELKTLGNRQNVLLGVATDALYQTLLAEGIQKEYCTELLTDVVWKGYETWIVLPRAVARLLARDPQKQMELMLRMFLHYPFSRPGYDWKFQPESGRVTLDFYRCPVHDYFKARGEEEFFRYSWCTLDFALAQVMTKDGRYERPYTLSAGDERCNMKWYGKTKEPQK
jgi:hypothetical protein